MLFISVLLKCLTNKTGIKHRLFIAGKDDNIQNKWGNMVIETREQNTGIKVKSELLCGGWSCMCCQVQT